MTPRVQGGKLEYRSPPAQIADYYIALIDSGRIAAGDRLPGRGEVALIWNVGLKTAYNALRILIRAGWAVSVPKQGTYAARPQLSGS